MARTARKVGAAIERWIASGLLDPTKAEELRREAELEHQEATRRLGQILVASLAAVALILAAILFAQRNWPSLSDGVRTAVLLGAGLVVYLSGLRVLRRSSWRYSGVLLLTGGLGVFISGLAYSYNAWPDGTPPAVATGLLALAIPSVTTPIALREGTLTSGIHAAAAYGFLGLFFSRTFALDFDTVVWCLDGVTVVALGGLWYAVRYRRGGHTDRALAAFAVSMWAGLVLAAMTGTGPLDMQESALWPMDVWLLLVVGVTLWAIHLSPSDLRRQGYELNLALCVVVGGFLAMTTAAELLELDTEGATAFGATVGILAMTYGLRERSAQVLITGALMMLLNTWIFAVENAGAMGGVVALLVTAVVLFWVSTRIRATPGIEPPPASAQADPADRQA